MIDTITLGEKVRKDPKLTKKHKDEVDEHLDSLTARWDRVKDFMALRKERCVDINHLPLKQNFFSSKFSIFASSVAYGIIKGCRSDQTLSSRRSLLLIIPNILYMQDGRYLLCL